MPTECTKNYYEINRAIFKAIDSHVGSVYAEYRVEQEHTRKMGEHLEPYVKHTLAQLLVEELIKSDDFKIIKHENWLIGKVEFGVLLPFLKAIDKGSSGV